MITIAADREDHEPQHKDAEDGQPAAGRQVHAAVEGDSSP